MLKVLQLKRRSRMSVDENPTGCESPLLDLMPTPDRAGVYSVSTWGRDTGNFHSQDFEINVSADGLIVETIVWICQEQLSWNGSKVCGERGIIVSPPSQSYGILWGHLGGPRRERAPCGSSGQPQFGPGWAA